MQTVSNPASSRNLALPLSQPYVRKNGWLSRGGAKLELACPNALVRWAFYLSLCAIPFAQLYVPGTAERVGVKRLIQALIFGAILSRPRICLRLIPVSLLWFFVYCCLRVIA